MPRLSGLRQQIHQPSWDYWVRDIGRTLVQNDISLFGSASVGDFARTNMRVAGQLPSDQTIVIMALRSVVKFQSLNDPAFAANAPVPDFEAPAADDNDKAHDLYDLVLHGGYFNLIVGEKTEFTGPMWYAPAGGGVHGATTQNARNSLTNGLPSNEAVFILGRPVHTPSRQAITVQVRFFPFPIAQGAGGTSSGGTYPANLDPIQLLNAFDGLKVGGFLIDGLLTRDAQ